MTKRGLDHPDPTGDAKREPAKSEGHSGDTGPRAQSEEESTDASESAGAPDPLDALLARLADAPEQDVDSSPPRRLEPGARVSRYQVVRELGRGGFGVVYEARDGDLGRHVALKALRPDRLGRGGASGAKQRSLRLSLLQQEAEMVARLQHPNIVTLFDLVLQDGLPYLVLELLSGETLQAALARGPLAPGEAIDIGIQVARGLSHAHAAGVIHRDLKPSNVFRTHDGLVKLLDLGLARGLAGDALLPRAGTPGFMAPEQWRGAEDERSDVYGAGLLLHAMLGGRVPHAFSGTGSLPRSELESQSRPSREAAHPHAVLDVPASAPPDLAQLILRCCAADPTLRPQSARKLLEELLAFQRNTPLSPLSPLFDGPQTPQLAQPTRPTLPSPQRVQSSMRVVGLLLVLFIMGLSPWMITHHAPPELPEARAPVPAAPPPVQEAESFRETAPMLWARMGAAALLLNNGLVLIAGGTDESGPLTQAELFDPVAQAGAGAFRITAALASARQGATATLLGDGRALLAGGEGPAGSVGALELYEPNGNHGKGAFWSGPLLKTARSGHCAVALGDGRVLLAGGEHNGKTLGDAELFDPGAVAADGARGVLLGPLALGTARTHAACALLPDGRALIAGGLAASGAPLSSTELFDPGANGGKGAFVATGPLATARAFAAAARLDDGRVLIAGGVGAHQGAKESGTTASSRALASVERFDPSQNQGRGGFVTEAPLLSPRRAGAAVALANGALLIAGGSGDNDNRLASVELYSPDATPAARAVMNLSTPRGSPATALLADGRVLIAGGDQRAGRAVSSAELFRPRGLGRLGQVASTGSLHTARAFASSVALGDGSILIAGGRAGATLDSVERYEPRSGAFAEIGRLRVQRTGAAALPLSSGEVLVAGGLDASGAPVASGELLTLRDTSSSEPVNAEPARPALRTVAAPSLATARAFPGALLLADGRALIAGGSGPDGTALASAELFEPGAAGRPAAFAPTASLSVPRAEPMIARLPDGRALIAGGTSQSGVPLASAEIFDPLGNGGRGAFAATGPMAQARSRAVITLLPNGKLLVAGGLGQAALASAELFDPLADNGRGAFQPTGGLAVARQRACSVLLANGTALVIGGADAEGGSLASAEVFDPQGEDGLGSFALAAGLSIGRELPLCARLPGGGVLVAGGRNNGVLSSAEIWKPE